MYYKHIRCLFIHAVIENKYRITEQTSGLNDALNRL